MSNISRLPETTTRQLGSSLVITTSASLVKELLDNAIDAKATSIEVIISPDTIAKVEVRDNGIGIHPDDYDALGRRGHTSKLRTFEELATHGGKTLGFRGEALASANNLGNVTVTTKTSEEPVAAILHLQPGTGGVSTEKPASAPVGTTICITGLFGKTPVREQFAIKESKQTIDKIHELLKSYAMARPQLKLSLKVLQTPKQNWSYSPRRDAGVKEAVVQLFGAEVAAHCLEMTEKIVRRRPDEISLSQPVTQIDDWYKFETLLLKPDTDFPKIPKHTYFSVDGRPVAAKKGTMKRLLKIYKEYLNPESATRGNHFIRLNLVCPPGSYDVNIEPSKDDVLFSDQETILEKLRDMCQEVYGRVDVSRRHGQSRAPETRPDSNQKLPTPKKGTDQPSSCGSALDEASQPTQDQICEQAPSRPQSLIQHGDSAPAHSPPDSSLQLTQDSAPIPPMTALALVNGQPGSSRIGDIAYIHGPGDGITKGTGLSGWDVDMSTDFNVRTGSDRRKKSLRRNQKSRNNADVAGAGQSGDETLNPWSIARTERTRQRMDQETVQTDGLDRFSRMPAYEPPLTPDPPVLRHRVAPPRDLDVPHSRSLFGTHRIIDNLQPVVPGGPYRSPMSSPNGMQAHDASTVNHTISSKMLRPTRSHLPWSPPSSVERSRDQESQPIENLDSRVNNGLKQTTISFNGGQSKSRIRQPQGNKTNGVGQSHGLMSQQEEEGPSGFQRLFATAHRDLEYQRSRQEHSPFVPATQQLRIEEGCHQKPPINKPFKQLHPRIAPSAPQVLEDREPIKTTLPSGDPRAYLLRRQKSVAASGTIAKPAKLKRWKSGLLPLENVPSDFQTHVLLHIMEGDSQALVKSAEQLQRYDRYAQEGTLEEGLDMNVDEHSLVEQRLTEILLEQEYQEKTGDDAVTGRVDLSSLLKGKDIDTPVVM
ncbi:hypothetical protein F4778DRAFT_221877 [Xylariomycetidae sp. FL2044]|nr:hypothetical protein F4778DRAFT_221877 [Xylariomycetidae sp. FL2044]